jgi:hypothetical protein
VANLASALNRARPAAASVPGVVHVLAGDEAATFAGTGFLVSTTVVLTCAHVVCPFYRKAGRWVRGSQLGPLNVITQAGSKYRVVSTTHGEPTDAPTQDDWVALHLDRPAAEAPLRLVEGVASSCLHELSGRLETPGFRGVGGSLSLRLCGVPWGEQKVLRGQVRGGLPRGASGSPLTVRLPDGVAVLGMLYLGGEGAGQSDFHGSDYLLDVLHRHSLEPQTIAALRVLTILRSRHRFRLAAGLGAIACGLALSFFFVKAHTPWAARARTMVVTPASAARIDPPAGATVSERTIETNPGPAPIESIPISPELMNTRATTVRSSARQSAQRNTTRATDDPTPVSSAQTAVEELEKLLKGPPPPRNPGSHGR